MIKILKEISYKTLSILQLRFKLFLSTFFAIINLIPLLICKFKNKDKSLIIWFLYTSNYQKDILFNAIKKEYGISLYSDSYKELNQDKLYQINLNKYKQRKFSVEIKCIPETQIIFKIFSLDFIFPHSIYISSISPWIFKNLFIFSIFKLLKYLCNIKYVDDGISGTISNNRVQNYKFSPSPELVYSWNFNKYFINKYSSNINKLDFKILLNIIEKKSLYEINIAEKNKCNLIISSKYLDYVQIEEKLINNKQNLDNKNYYIPHPRAWKNSSYLLQTCVLVNSKNIESWIFNNAFNFKEVFIGVSATTLIFAELILLKKINMNLNLLVTDSFGTNNSKKELFSFVESAISSEAYKTIYFNGRLLKIK